MRKTKKEQYLQAALDTAKEYENKGHIRESEYCFYCKITLKDEKGDCRGCPMSTFNGYPGCMKMQTYDSPTQDESLEEIPSTSKIRAKFHREAYKIMENIDKKYFTYSYWTAKAFQPLWELDKKLATTYKG